MMHFLSSSLCKHPLIPNGMFWWDVKGCEKCQYQTSCASNMMEVDTARKTLLSLVSQPLKFLQLYVTWITSCNYSYICNYYVIATILIISNRGSEFWKVRLKEIDRKKEHLIRAAGEWSVYRLSLINPIGGGSTLQTSRWSVGVKPWLSQGSQTFTAHFAVQSCVQDIITRTNGGKHFYTIKAKIPCLILNVACDTKCLLKGFLGEISLVVCTQ